MLRTSKENDRWLRTAISVGLLTGIADGFIVSFDTFHTFSSILFFLPLTWIVWCVLVRALFLIRPIKRLGNVALFMAGPGILVISRLGPEMVHRIHVSVIRGLILSAIVAVVVAFLLARFIPPRIWKYGPIVAALWLAGTGAFLFVDRHDRGAIAAKSPASAAAPNTLLIFLDTVRHDDAGQMPNLSAFAANAAVYDRAWAPAPWTIPSHFAMLTGVEPWKVPYDEKSEHMRYDGPTLAEQFATRGYVTAAIFANPLLSRDDVFRRGFQQFEYSLRCVACSSGLAWLVSRALVELKVPDPFATPVWMKASEVTARAENYMRSQKQPFFLALNYMDAHEPYYVEPSCRSATTTNVANSDWRAWENARDRSVLLPPEESRRFHSRYRDVLHCLDRSLGSLFDALRRTERGQHTIVAIVSDHGEQFGDHGLVSHGQSLYRQLLHVPLIIRIPGQQPQRITDDVSIIDVHNELLRYVPETRQTPMRRQPVIGSCKLVMGSQHGPQSSGFSIVRGRYHFIRWNNGREELYDLDSDYDELKPLPLRSDDRTVGELRAELASRTREISADAIGLKAIGYLQ